MLVILPVVLLLVPAVIVLVLQRLRPSYGYAWLGCSAAVLITWVVTLVYHWQVDAGRTFSLVIPGWQTVEGVAPALSFQLDSFSWPFVFALASLAVGVILTASARLSTSIPEAWAGSMALVAAGMLAVMANSVLALVLAWTVIDLAELAMFVRGSPQPTQARQAVVAFAARVGGTGAAIWAMMVSRAFGSTLELAAIPDQAAVFLLMAAGLRLGVLPLHLPFQQEIRMRRGLGTVLRLVAPAATLPLLSRLPATVAAPEVAPFFLLFTGLAAVYGAAMWLFSSDEINGRPYWLIALAGMALGSAVRGQTGASVMWGVALILSGGAVFLFNVRQRALLILPMITLIGLTGLPFTPAASGWPGLVVLPFSLLDVVMISAHSLLLAGFLRHALAPSEGISESDRWVKVVYPIGLGILGLSFWLIGFLGAVTQNRFGIWWAALISLVLMVLGYGVAHLLRRIPAERTAWAFVLARRIGLGIAAFLRLDWFYGLLTWLYGLVQRVINFITVILEGAGGVLWALLLLALLLTLFSPGAGAP